MASVTKNPEAKDAMEAAQEPEKRKIIKAPPLYPPAGRPPTPPPPTVYNPGAGGSGFFHIYKKGQGSWTRLGTVAAITLVGLLTARFVYQQSDLDPYSHKLPYTLTGLFAFLYTAAAFYFLNKPSNVDFLIATDSEMKKVNWTSRKELIGSTRVVIFFMFLVAVTLFMYDQIFGILFYAIGVLKLKPPFWPGH